MEIWDKKGDELHARLKALTDDGDIRGWAAAVCRVLVRVVDTEHAFAPLDQDDRDAIDWLCGHAELDNGIYWSGRWHDGDPLLFQPPDSKHSVDEGLPPPETDEPPDRESTRLPPADELR